MKKIIALCFITTCSLNLFSQGYGFKGGITTSNVIGDDVENNDSKTGIYIAAFANKEYNGVRWSPEIVYQQKGAQNYNPIYEKNLKVTLNYIDVAVNGHFHINDELALSGGPYIGYLVSGSYELPSINPYTNEVSVSKETIEDWDGTNRIEFGGSFGAAYHVNDLLHVNINYEIGFTSIFEDDNVYNTALKFGVGYIFSY